jgi:hypothetical protein
MLFLNVDNITAALAEVMALRCAYKNFKNLVVLSTLKIN